MRISPLLPDKASHPGRTGVGVDNRSFVIDVCGSCARAHPRRACRERYGKWKAVHRRFSRWCHAAVWERAFDALTADRTIGT
ncbi:transposase [Rhizobium leguminosarum]|uniref:transposase n=1 Tax=Rhizobium leguminosarum TaxID=384 RepID=UPI001C941635|nr:transposase [Rhizobium leguminosarum]MBY5573925.1 transposase [Rhizobium leguminosarum]